MAIVDIRRRPGCCAWWVTLCIRPVSVAFAWTVMGKRDVIHTGGPSHSRRN